MCLLRLGNTSYCPTFNIGWDPVLLSQSNLRAARRYSIDISVKNIFTRVATWVFCEEIVKSAQLCSRYFTSNIKVVLALGSIVTNVFLGSMVPVFQHAFREFINTAIQNSNEFDLYIYPLVYLLNIVFSIAIVQALNGVLCKKLRDDLGFEMRDELFRSWSETKAWDRYKETGAGKKIKNPDVVIALRSTSVCKHLVDLVNARISTLSLFLGALRSMYLNSGFLTISFLGITLELPYLILICFLYVSGFAKASFWTNAIFKKNTEDEQEQVNILIKNGSSNYEKNNENIHDINKRSLLPQFGLSFLNNINTNISMLIGACVLLASGNIDGITIAYMAQNFSYAAIQASWHRIQLEPIKKLDVSYENVILAFNVLDELTEKEDISVVVESD